MTRDVTPRSRGRQAFSETVDPSVYVPRKATESVLSLIESWARDDGIGSTVATLMAGPGVGKTFLLRTFESHINARPGSDEGSRRALYLPYAGLSVTDLCVWVHGLLGRSIDLPDSSDPPAATLAALTALCDLTSTPEDPFFLVIDDANSMPTETIRAFAVGLPRKGSSLRILMALNDDAKSSRLLAVLDPLHPRTLAFRGEMSEAETAAYLHARMKWAGFEDQEIAKIDSEAVRQIHLLSGGVARRIHMIAAKFLESGIAVLPRELDEKQKRENWMGRPIEDDP